MRSVFLKVAGLAEPLSPAVIKGRHQGFVRKGSPDAGSRPLALRRLAAPFLAPGQAAPIWAAGAILACKPAPASAQTALMSDVEWPVERDATGPHPTWPPPTSPAPVTALVAFMLLNAPGCFPWGPSCTEGLVPPRAPRGSSRTWLPLNLSSCVNVTPLQRPSLAPVSKVAAPPRPSAIGFTAFAMAARLLMGLCVGGEGPLQKHLENNTLSVVFTVISQQPAHRRCLNKWRQEEVWPLQRLKTKWQWKKHVDKRAAAYPALPQHPIICPFGCQVALFLPAKDLRLPLVTSCHFS